MIVFTATSILHNFSLLKANIHKIVISFNILKLYMCLIVLLFTFYSNQKCFIKYQEAKNSFSEIVHHHFHQLTPSHSRNNFCFTEKSSRKWKSLKASAIFEKNNRILGKSLCTVIFSLTYCT